MATPMLHDILLFVLAPGDKSERERSINACKRYGRVTSTGRASTSGRFSAMAPRDRRIPTAIAVKPTLF
jgi:hypothetical protein